MRIALVVHQFPPQHLGGTEVYTQGLAQALADRGHQVGVFYPRADLVADRQIEDDGLSLWEAANPPLPATAHPLRQFWRTFRNPRLEASFRRFIAGFRPDLVHFQHVQNVSVRLIELAAGRPRLLTLHDYWYICANGQLLRPDGSLCPRPGIACAACALARLPSPLPRWVQPAVALPFLARNLYIRRALRGVDRFVAPSRFLIERYTAAGFPAARLLYLENGIPVERICSFSPEPSDGPLRVTFIGSIAWQKGVHVLAQAVAKLPPGAVRLRIWGDPTVFPAYARQVRALLADPEAQMRGRIENERVGQALAESDLIVVPSLWYENSPVVIQEARAAGVPVVVSGHGALAEKVHHRVNGLHFAPGDAGDLARSLLRCLDEPDLLPNLRQSIPEPMDMGAHVEELLAIYQQVNRA
jgi:glycosyltransferase involved in cell wall biosynthesis